MTPKTTRFAHNRSIKPFQRKPLNWLYQQMKAHCHETKTDICQFSINLISIYLEKLWATKQHHAKPILNRNYSQTFAASNIMTSSQWVSEWGTGLCVSLGEVDKWLSMAGQHLVKFKPPLGGRRCTWSFPGRCMRSYGLCFLIQPKWSSCRRKANTLGCKLGFKLLLVFCNTGQYVAPNSRIRELWGT